MRALNLGSKRLIRSTDWSCEIMNYDKRAIITDYDPAFIARLKEVEQNSPASHQIIGKIHAFRYIKSNIS